MVCVNSNCGTSFGVSLFPNLGELRARSYVPLIFFRYNIPEQCRLDLTETDIKFAKSLLEKVNSSALLQTAICKSGNSLNLGLPSFFRIMSKGVKNGLMS